MDKNKFFLNFIKNKEDGLLKSIAKAKDARDNAPAAIESHSDTRRSQAEKLVQALEIELSSLLKIKDKIAGAKLTYFEIEMNGNLNKFLMVPSGLGGDLIDGVRLLSEDTPLGGLIKNGKIGDSFDFNGQKMAILKVE